MAFKESPKICPVCGGQGGGGFGFVKDFNLKEGAFSLYECKDCKVQFYMPFKKIESKDYESKDSYDINRFLKPRIFRGYHKKFLKKNKKYFSGTKALDLGCGTGEFLNELKKRGCRVFGVDFDSEAVKYAKKYFNLENVYDMPFEDFFRQNDFLQFDFIFCFEVLQYLDRPQEFFESLKKILGPGGKIILSQPSRNRMLAGLDAWDLPSHCLTRWSKESILNLFSKFGFKIFHISYVEQLKILMGAVNSKARLGIVAKSVNNLKNTEKEKFLLIPKLLYFLGKIKGFVIGFLPAVFLWVFGKIFNRENGIIYLEFKKNE